MKWLHLSIRKQLFIAFASSSLILIFIVLVGVKTYISQQFLSYLSAQEAQRLQQLAYYIGDFYSEQFTSKPPHPVKPQSRPQTSLQQTLNWEQVFQAIEIDRLLNKNSVFNDPQLAFTDLALLDLNRVLILGDEINQPLEVPIYDGNDSKKIIAYLQTQVPKAAMAPLDEVFQQKQQLAFMFAGGLALVIAALTARFFSQWQSQRILKLEAASYALVQGKYERVIELKGTDELSALGLALNTLAKRLAENKAQRHRFFSNIAHELRTPLAILRGEIEAIQDGIREATPTQIQKLHRQTIHLIKLTSDIDLLAKSEAGELQLQKQVRDVIPFAQHLQESFQTRFEAAGLDFTFILEEGVLNTTQIYVDLARIQQVFTNLLENSLKYTQTPGQVQLTVALEAPNWVRWEIADSAPGVSAINYTKLTERLYRPDISRNKAEGGSGLGLSIVQSLVQSHDGQLSIQASQFGGLAVTVRLPQYFKTQISGKQEV